MINVLEVYQAEINGFLYTNVGPLILPLADPMIAEPFIPTAHGSSHGLTPAAPFSGNPLHNVQYPSIHRITPSLISTPITTVPRPPSLHLEDHWVTIRIFSEVLAVYSHTVRARGGLFVC